MDVLIAVDQLDELIHRSTSWFTFSPKLKRVDAVRLRDAIEHLRAEVNLGLEVPGRRRCLPLVDGLDKLTSDARTFPIFGGLLLDTERVYDILDQLRQDLVVCLKAQLADA